PPARARVRRERRRGELVALELRAAHARGRLRARLLRRAFLEGPRHRARGVAPDGAGAPRAGARRAALPLGRRARLGAQGNAVAGAGAGGAVQRRVADDEEVGYRQLGCSASQARAASSAGSPAAEIAASTSTSGATPSG